jgi:dTDP-4-amino-4,6-dideoxygalactose transaminase
MTWRLPLGDVRLSEPVIEASMKALRSNWLTMGPRTEELEREFAARQGMAHGIAVSSGAAALHLSGLAAGVGPGDEVIVPAVGFVADAHVAHWCGGETVFADVESAEWPLLDVDAVDALINERTKAVIVIHMFGYGCELDGLRARCADRGVALIEDCCEAAGGTFADGAPLGTRSLAGCFSFFAKTQLPVGEGGIVVTDDDRAAARVRSLRSHAMTSATWDRHRGHAETYDITDLGFNYRIDEPRAAMAQAHLAALDEKLGRLRSIVARYREQLGGVDGIVLPFTDDAVMRSGHFVFPVLLADRATRDRVRSGMIERRIQTSLYPAITELSLYAGQGRRYPCPRAEEFCARHLALPLSSVMSFDQVDLACAELAAVLES